MLIKRKRDKSPSPRKNEDPSHISRQKKEKEKCLVCGK